MIKVSALHKKFEDIDALKNINFQVKKGSIYGLLGTNGAGKTTLLKIIAGIYKEDSGEVNIDGEQVFENISLKNRIIYLPDSLYFFSQSTIRQMAHFYQSTYSNWNQDRFELLKASFPINIDKKIHRLSKGMQRQVAFWLAFCAMPDIMILDEPLDGLDAVMRQKIKNLLIQDVAEREMTILISSHNLREVEDLCDHIGILHNGKLVIEKELDELKSDIHKIQVAFSNPVHASFLKDFQILHRESRGSVSIWIVKGDRNQIDTYVRNQKPVIFDLLPLTLEEIFIYEMGDMGYAIENIVV
ncbi:ABC transporter ATP-binding protein [Bacillus sp. CGMCC 1.16607]|uniref:ABC transporter ATP-binding protein n=1 Tax=Bacillus sp. CGMCC 1.16607 TaxID=3351842 RepID=UPI0036272FAC